MPSSPLDCTHGKTCRVRNAHMGLGLNKRSNNISRNMPSSPLRSTYGRIFLGVECPHVPWATHTVGRHCAFHAIITLGKHTISDEVGRGMPSSAMGSSHGRTTLSRYAIITLGKHTQLDDVRRGRLSSPLDRTRNHMSSGVACLHGP